MIYTCYEMIRDCRADKPEGWLHFISNYIPVVRQVAAHYAPMANQGPNIDIPGIVKFLRQPDSLLFQSLEPAPERWFVAELRQRVIAQLPAPADLSAAASPIDLEILSDAFQPLTLTEKQAVWMETMLYPAAEAGPMLRMAPATVEKVRERAAELLRGKLDVWNRQVLAENGRALGAAAAAGATKDCQSAKVFLDILDGRTSWRGREEMERHVLGCWHCIDLFCRMVEVVHLLRIVKPLEESEAQPYRELLGVAAAKKRRWF
jgi:hypothetical protein